MCNNIADGGKRCFGHVFLDIPKNAERITKAERILTDNSPFTEEEKVRANALLAKQAENIALSKEEKAEQKKLLRISGSGVLLTTDEEQKYYENLTRRDVLNKTLDELASKKKNKDRREMFGFRKEALLVAAEAQGLEDPNRTELTLEEAQLREITRKLRDIPYFDLAPHEKDLADRIYAEGKYRKETDIRIQKALLIKKVYPKTYANRVEGERRHKELSDLTTDYDNCVKAKEIFTRLQKDPEQFAILENPNATEEEIASLSDSYGYMKKFPEHYSTLKSNTTRYNALSANPEKKAAIEARVQIFKDNRVIEASMAHSGMEEAAKRLNANKVVTPETKQAELAAAKISLATREANLQNLGTSQETKAQATAAAKESVAAREANLPMGATPNTPLVATFTPPVKNAAVKPVVKPVAKGAAANKGIPSSSAPVKTTSSSATKGVPSSSASTGSPKTTPVDSEAVKNTGTTTPASTQKPASATPPVNAVPAVTAQKPSGKPARPNPFAPAASVVLPTPPTKNPKVVPESPVASPVTTPAAEAEATVRPTSTPKTTSSVKKPVVAAPPVAPPVTKRVDTREDASMNAARDRFQTKPAAQTKTTTTVSESGLKSHQAVFTPSPTFAKNGDTREDASMNAARDRFQSKDKARVQKPAPRPITFDDAPVQTQLPIAPSHVVQGETVETVVEHIENIGDKLSRFFRRK